MRALLVGERDPFIDVAVEVVDALRRAATVERPGGLSLVDGVEGGAAAVIREAGVECGEDERAPSIREVEVALRGVAREAVDVRAHLFALAREVEFLFGAEALA